jgi:hypothetical protein
MESVTQKAYVWGVTQRPLTFCRTPHRRLDPPLLARLGDLASQGKQDEIERLVEQGGTMVTTYAAHFLWPALTSYFQKVPGGKEFISAPFTLDKKRALLYVSVTR